MSRKDKPQQAPNRAPIEDRPPIEGEGSRSADADYRARAEAFVKSGRVPEAAAEAARAIEGEEAEELERAEEEGRSHAKEEDPEVTAHRRRKPRPQE